MSQKTKLVVIGASGCIGRNVVAFFTSENLREHFEVVPVSRSDCDLLDRNASTRIARFWDEKSVVIPLPFVSRWKEALDSGGQENNFDSNRRINRNLSKALQCSPPGHCLYVSTSGVYGIDSDKHLVSEQGPREATDRYGRAKIEAEDSLTSVASGRFPLAVLRLTIAYGCGNELSAYQPHGMAEMAVKGQTICLWGDGTELRDFLHTSDLMRVMEAVIGNRYDGVMNVGSGYPTSYASIVEVLRENLPDVRITHRERTRPKVDLTYDNSLLRDLMGREFEFTKPERFVASFLTGSSLDRI